MSTLYYAPRNLAGDPDQRGAQITHSRAAWAPP
jgi:hypothetical protein